MNRRLNPEIDIDPLAEEWLGEVRRSRRRPRRDYSATRRRAPIRTTRDRWRWPFDKGLGYPKRRRDVPDISAPVSTGTDASGTPLDEPPGQPTEYVRWVQHALNQLMGLRLPEDGILGPDTRSAIRGFQRRKSLPADGVVGPQTERALIAALRSPSKAKRHGPTG